MNGAACALADRSASLLFPDDCRVCAAPLLQFSRVPVCNRCLSDPKPMEAEYFCAACKTPFLNSFPLDEQGLCALCRLGAKGFDAVYSYGSYEGSMRELVHLFKYDGMRPLARTLGAMMTRALPRERTFDVIVPMPLHWRKQWSRGFNQAELLAHEVAKTWRVPVKRAVKRRKSTAVQAGLTNSKRRLNVAGAFRAKGRLDGLHVLLIDDVLTTGSTASACAGVMKRAGAASVTLLTLARTDRRIAAENIASKPRGKGKTQDIAKAQFA